MRDVIIGGSSVTDEGPWPTWATWLKNRYCDNNFVDTSVKGLGNEAIILRAISKARLFDRPAVIVQLTNVDKWDWYVENTELIDQLSREKHQVTQISAHDTAGFWSTGSHFPKWKSHYREHYFSLQYQAWHTLQMIHWLQLTCRAQNWDHYIIFDSPLLAVTEQQLNQGLLDLEDCASCRLADNTLSQLVFDLIDWSNIYRPGLIGYALCNDLSWFNPRAKGHPGSLVHFNFMQEIIVPAMDLILDPCEDLEQHRLHAQQMQRVFDQF